MSDKNLRLQVVFSALDRITGPLKRITGESGATAKALKATRDRLKDLQSQQGAIGQFRQLHGELRTTSGQLQEAQQRVGQLAQQMKTAETPTRAMTREFNAAVRSATALKEKAQQQSQQLQTLRTRLSEAGFSTSNLSTHERRLRTDIASTNKTLADQERRLKATADRMRQLGDAKARYEKTMLMRNQLAGTGVGMTGAGVAGGLPVLKTVRDYMAFEDSMLGIAKQVEGARDANGKLTAVYYEMGDEIRRLSTEIPMATTELAALVTAGARMGIQGKENLLSFARDTAMMATAFELPAEEIGDQMGKIAGIFKIPIRSLGSLGDAINYLDDNAISKGRDIINVLQGDLAGAASTIGLSANNAAALASTMLTLGESPERADTAASGMLRQLQIAKMNPERFQVGAQMIGMSGAELQLGMVKDAQGTILQVLDRINALPTESKMEAVTRLFGKDWGGAIAKLAGGVDEYRRQLELANGAAAKGSMGREFQARLDALSAQWEILKNRTFGFTSTLGATLAPALKDLMQTLGNVMDRISAWVQENPVLAGTLLKIAAVVTALLVGLGGLALTIAAMLGPFAIMQFLMAAVGIKGLGLMTILRGLGSAVMWLGRVFLLLGRALLLNPIGLAVTAIAGLAYLIYANWEPIKTFFTGLWPEVKQAASGGIAGISALILNWSPLGLFHTALSTVLGWFGIELPAKFSEFGANILRGLAGGITGALGAAKEAITGAGGAVIGWFKEKLGIRSPSRVFAELGGHITEGLAIGIAGNENSPIKRIGGLASRLAQVGAGVAIGAATLPAMAFDTRPPIQGQAAAPAANGGNHYEIHIHAAQGMDPQAIAHAVAAELDRRDRARAARTRSSLHDYD